MGSKYIDPPNTEEIIKSLFEAEKHNDVQQIIISTFPDWILGLMDSYSRDYPHLQKNWEFVCNEMKTNPTKIAIVDYIDTSSLQHKLIGIFCELMTRLGYCVRRKEELISCEKCGDAIPNLDIWKKIKQNNLPHPPYWSKKCRVCKKKN